MKGISALLIAAAMCMAAGVQAQVGDVTRTAVSSTSELQQKVGDVRSAAKFKADCAAGIALDSCAKPVTPPGCPAGQHWTTTGPAAAGTNIAHCVADDPTCVLPKTLHYDAYGNPSCSAPVITKQVEERYKDCAYGYIGHYGSYQKRTVTYTDGVQTSATGWTEYWTDCQYVGGGGSKPPTCSNGATDYPTCTPPTCSNGAKDYPTCTPPTCSNGATDYPTCTPPVTTTPPTTCSNGATNYPTCTLPSSGNNTPPPPTCSASDVVVSSTDCDAGMAGGPIQQHQTVSCPGSVVGSYSSGTCTPAVCANGAKNYPTCTLDQTPTCPKNGFYCTQERGQSGDPRDDWYYWGVITYEGPSCTPVYNSTGSISGDAGGCPDAP